MSDASIPTTETTNTNSESTPEIKSSPSVPDTKASDASPDSKAETKVDSQAPTEKKKYKVKIDKEEREIDEDELVRNYQLREASDRRFKEASAKHKEAEAFIELLRTNPRAVLSHKDIGHDVRKLAEEILAEELEMEFMDPKEKEIRALRKEKAEREEQAKRDIESARQAKEAEAVKGYETAYAADIESTVKASGLPMNIHTVNAVRDYMLIAFERGNEDVKASDVIADVKKDYQDAVKSLFATSDMASLVSLLGEETLKKVREHDLQRLKDPKKSNKVSKAEQPTAKPERSEKQFITVNDYFEQLKKRVS